MPDKRQEILMVPYISGGVVRAKATRGGVSRKRGRGVQYHIISPISFVKSCFHFGHFASLYNSKLFNKVAMSVSF